MDTIKRLNVQDFCCKYMVALLNNPDAPIEYNPITREYDLTIPDLYLDPDEGCDSFGIDFCPRCGTKLPKNLIEEWAEILRSEYNIDDPYDPKQKKLIPKEFFTDEWWKNRGL
jgi:hypothetical protein